MNRMRTTESFEPDTEATTGESASEDDKEQQQLH
jgi:hypothetical protein